MIETVIHGHMYAGGNKQCLTSVCDPLKFYIDLKIFKKEEFSINFVVPGNSSSYESVVIQMGHMVLEVKLGKRICFDDLLRISQ